MGLGGGGGGGGGVDCFVTRSMVHRRQSKHSLSICVADCVFFKLITNSPAVTF